MNRVFTVIFSLLSLTFSTSLRSSQLTFSEVDLQYVVKQSDVIALLEKKVQNQYIVKSIYFLKDKSALKKGQVIVVTSPVDLFYLKSKNSGLSISRRFKRYTPSYIEEFKVNIKQYRNLANELEEKVLKLGFSYTKSFHLVDGKMNEKGTIYPAILQPTPQIDKVVKEIRELQSQLGKIHIGEIRKNLKMVIAFLRYHPDGGLQFTVQDSFEHPSVKKEVLDLIE